MGSVKFKDLKAYVRYDGSGRVVAGSLVFRKKKPKNGRWMEISSNLCCNASGSTTTTTTTQGGGGVTPTAFVKGYWLNINDSCTTTTAGELLCYSASSTLAEGVAIYFDAALTIPVTQGYVISLSPVMAPPLLVGAGGVLNAYNCPSYNTYPVIPVNGNECFTAGNDLQIGGDVGNDGVIYGNFASIGYPSDSLFFVKYSQSGITYIKQFKTAAGGSSAIVWGGAIAC